MSAPIAIQFDLSRFRALAKGTRHVIASGAVRAVRIGLEDGAAHARANHVHTRRTGRLTSSETLRGELRSATADGAWGYLLNATPYSRHVEEGTAAHPILPRDYHFGAGRYAGRPTSRVTGKRISGSTMGAGRGRALRFVIGGRVVFASSVQHPGTKPMPFMAPASVVAGERIIDETERVTFRLASDLWE